MRICMAAGWPAEQDGIVISHRVLICQPLVILVCFVDDESAVQAPSHPKKTTMMVDMLMAMMTVMVMMKLTSAALALHLQVRERVQDRHKVLC